MGILWAHTSAIGCIELKLGGAQYTTTTSTLALGTEFSTSRPHTQYQKSSLEGFRSSLGLAWLCVGNLYVPDKFKVQLGIVPRVHDALIRQ